MYCTKCGEPNDDNAHRCTKCQEFMATPDEALRGGAEVPASIPNYLVPSILVTLFCCLPPGIVAIVYAAQVNGKIEAGDYEGAMAASKNAKTWTWVSFGLGLGGTILYLAFVGLTMARL